MDFIETKLLFLIFRHYWNVESKDAESNVNACNIKIVKKFKNSENKGITSGINEWMETYMIDLVANKFNLVSPSSYSDKKIPHIHNKYKVICEKRQFTGDSR